MYTRTNTQKRIMQAKGTDHLSSLTAYPIDMLPLLALWRFTLDNNEIPLDVHTAEYYPTAIAQYALDRWNQYIITNDEKYRQAFLKQAYWLVEHEVYIARDIGGWPISFPHPGILGGNRCLSALAQGHGLSVLTRAYLLTHEETFLDVAHRAVRTFERDILDGGVCAPLAEGWVFFEEVAVYPALHTLSGFILSLFGLYDYVTITGDAHVECTIRRSLAVMHSVIDEFDAGFWTRFDLLHRHLSTPSQLALQTALLKALAIYSSCEHCKALAARWNGYQHQLMPRLLYLQTTLYTASCKAVWNSIGNFLFCKKKYDKNTVNAPKEVLHVCVPITAFPVAGGMRSVLTNVGQVTRDIWQLEFLTHRIGPNPESFVIHQFGTRRMAPWQFPFVWFYTLAGFCKFVSLLRKGAAYDLILLQDGVFTAAFSGLAAKMAGIRSVCIDHGNLSLLKNHAYRDERLNTLETMHWSRRLLARLQYKCYWPSLSILARIGALFVDHYFIPGVAGDGMEETCKHLGVPQSHITRFGSMVEIERYTMLDPLARANVREKKGIATDAIVICMICRLAPEKGVDIALEAINISLVSLLPAKRSLLRIIIVGDGPLRKEVEEDICRLKLNDVCTLWGETSPEEVALLLSISDIFLYTSRRGACFSMAVLEAMASGCAVIATTEPVSNAHLLSADRGIAVPANDIEEIGMALVRLVNDEKLRSCMGRLARKYIIEHHSSTIFRRALLQITYWSGLDEFLEIESKG